MRLSTICFLIDGENILLAEKLKRFGAGWLNGYGGKIEEGETPETGAIREIEEEAGIEITEENLEKIAVIDFFEVDEHMFKCHIYFVKDWKGEPKASEEMGAPQKFPLSAVPFEKMWPGDRVWLPLVTSGKKITATVRYDKGNKNMTDFQYKEGVVI